MKKLQELLSFKIDHSLGKKVVSSICDNSKHTPPESMFIALGRDITNRKNHINEAISNGAKYILQDSENGENYFTIKDNILFLFAKNVRRELAHVASTFFRSNFEILVAVTGTNGKTSTVDILRQIWIESGISAASIGTLGVITREKCEKLPHNMTSPDCVELHRILHTLCESGIKNIAMETTSQAIDQHRIDEIRFNLCAFTNLSQDHLDYHKTFENYWNAKERLFSELADDNSIFVVNDDDKYSEKIYEIAQNRGIKCFSYGRSSNDIKIMDIIAKEYNQRVKISFFGKEISFVLPLQGAFQVYNSVCAAVTAHLLGLDLEKIIDHLPKLQSINGRLELIAQLGATSVYIDYAHTPDALKNALLALRNHAKKRIITVFGCGGNRDQQKRILMGEVAQKFSDFTIITDDNPRNEDPEQIRKMILQGCPEATEIGDRKEAIEFAINMSSDGDILLIAGKGHEIYQQKEGESLDFSDRKTILEAVQK
ncbi:MAG: UDP-N-acetylmuramoyl-L-alanyl-D-glutamate--2,6-diaminopimelate ligase [Holosporaceae bacterium]|jgi:UDP-N-acetylmuramoyl-L-alanyl-D-glutamate--2,6-diaminopimelate ligase|nr:UDP-N-acetylmuramoyl-L-alanyl-D-glutamate--2,6-diaminopimelate ligase [Holosporaceae bacterium]